MTMLAKIKELLSIIKAGLVVALITVYGFVVDHLKQILYGLVMLCIIAFAFLAYRNPIERAKVMRVAKVAVKMHLRMLPDGYSHSPAKAAEAAKLGITLLENQTIVDPYVKTIIKGGH